MAATADVGQAEHDAGLPGWKVMGGVAVLSMVVASLVAVVPTVLTALVVWLYAWKRKVEARQLRWPVGLVAVGLPVATMLWHWDWAAPWRAWWSGMQYAWDLEVGAGLVETSGVWAPLGAVAGASAWAMYRFKIQTGRARTLQWQQHHEERIRAGRVAEARKRAVTESVPLTVKEEGERRIVIGPFVEEVGGVTRSPIHELRTRHPRYLTLSPKAVDQHMINCGDSGSGKTTLLRRLALGVTEANWERHRRGEINRQLTITLDCKGGPEAVATGEAWAEDMARIGVSSERIGVWPVDRLDIWSMAPRDLQSTLQTMIRSSHEHYDELREALLHLVVDMPGRRPPRNSVEFLERMNPDDLRSEWASHPVEAQMVRAVTEGREPAYFDAVLKYSNLFRNLGASLDAGRPLNDFDALYYAVAGTRRPKEARAQAGAMIQLITDLLHREQRHVTVIVDEYSAVSGEGGISLAAAAERWRSLGAQVVAAAQSKIGFGDDTDDRDRLINTCSGGRLLMRTTDGDEFSKISGTYKKVEPSQHTVKGKWGEEGSGRIQDTFRVDPDRLRQAQTGDVCLAQYGRAEWGVVALVPDLRGPRLSPVGAIRDRMSVSELEQGRKRVVGDLNDLLGGGGYDA